MDERLHKFVGAVVELGSSTSGSARDSSVKAQCTPSALLARSFVWWHIVAVIVPYDGIFNWPARGCGGRSPARLVPASGTSSALLLWLPVVSGHDGVIAANSAQIGSRCEGGLFGETLSSQLRPTNKLLDNK